MACAICFTLEKRPSTHSTGGWLCLQAGLDGCRKSRQLWPLQIYLLVDGDTGVMLHGL